MESEAFVDYVMLSIPHFRIPLGISRIGRRKCLSIPHFRIPAANFDNAKDLVFQFLILGYRGLHFNHQVL